MMKKATIVLLEHDFYPVKISQE